MTTTERAPGATWAPPAAMLRAGFPYMRTLGMRRVTFYPLDVAVGGEGRIYTISRFDLTGNVRVTTWDDDDLGALSGGWTWPAGLALDEEERLYVSDEGEHTVTVLTREGQTLRRWGKQGSKPGELNRPSHLAFDHEGHLWVSDTRNHRVQQLTRDGEPLRSLGEFGGGPGQLNMPWGVAVDPAGAVYVADWRNDRVQKFDPDGRPSLVIGRSGTGDGEFHRPAGVAVDQHGDIYVCDRGNHRVQLFDHTGRYIEQFRGDATLSKMGRLYILSNQKVLRLREMAKLEPQKRFRAPSAVRVLPDGRMFVADYGSHRVQVYQKEAYPLSESEVMPPPRSVTLSTV